MKRFLTFLLAIMIVMTAVAQVSGIVLSYNKGQELKFYKTEQIAEVIDRAEPNDTVYFGMGNFNMDYLSNNDGFFDGYPAGGVSIINKPLTFIGSGAHPGGTSFYGSQGLIVNIDTYLDDSMKTFSFEGISFDSDSNGYNIEIASNLQELKFANSRFGENFYIRNEESKGVINNLIIDRCSFVDFAFNDVISNRVDMRNTKITGSLFGQPNMVNNIASLDHCYLGQIESDFVGIIRHSLVYLNKSQYVALNNCGYYLSEGGEINNCINIPVYNHFEAESLDDDPSSIGFCDDGSTYGTSGGATPFTLYAQYPTPDTSKDELTNKYRSFIDYDPISKKLTIQMNCLYYK